jgi:hypothetical protein
LRIGSSYVYSSSDLVADLQVKVGHDSCHDDNQQNDTQHIDIMLRVVMRSVKVILLSSVSRKLNKISLNFLEKVAKNTQTSKSKLNFKSPKHPH